MSNINFEADQREDLNSVNDAKSLSDQVVKLKELEDDLEQKEKELKELKRHIDLVSGEVIPTMMQEMNISTLKLADGSSVEVKPVYGASISVAKKEEAYTWLRENGLGDLIKNEITVSFGRNEDNKAAEYANLARSEGYEPIQDEKVHPQTLKVVMKEWKDKGREVPAELFNTFDGNQTQIKNKK